MPVIISLLRGVNLASHNRINMSDLRALYESLGFRDVETHVQSGNVVFRTERRDLRRLGTQIEDAIEREFGFKTAVVLRTASELRDVIARNPLAARRDIDPSRFLVAFFAREPGQEAREKLRAIKTDPEELHIEDREVYLYYPNGLARPNLSWVTVEKMLKTTGTGRNWNTVTKLLEIAERLETLG